MTDSNMLKKSANLLFQVEPWDNLGPYQESSAILANCNLKIRFFFL